MGCLKSLVSLVLIGAIAIFAFLNRDRIVAKWNELRGREADVVAVPSEKLADAAHAKLMELKTGERDRVALSEIEIQSLLQYKYPELLPAFVDSPTVELEGDRIRIKARVPLDRIPRLDELGDAALILPDTTELSLTGQLLPLRSGRVAMSIDQVRAARIPLPQRLVASALAKLGRKDEPGLPREALAVPLPPGADAAYVRGDSLVFISNGRK